MGFTVTSAALGAAQQVLNPIQLPPGGYLRYVDVQVTCTTAGNAAAVTFNADAPWNAIASVDLRNSAGDSLIVPMTGYQLFLINKYGCLSQDPPSGDPRLLNNGFLATAGAGATGGSFGFFLRIPCEFDPRDAIAAVPNLAANKSYQLQFIVNTAAAVYGVNPTALAAVTLTGIEKYWSKPNDTTPAGTGQETAPLGNGTLSLWRLEPANALPGDQMIQVHNVGNVLRCIIFVLRTAAGARSAADWPATSQLILNDDIQELMPTAFWQRDMAQAYGYSTGAAEAALGLDNGVFVYSDWMKQRGAVRADGPRDQFLVTYNTTLLQLRGTVFGATASSLEIITNEIKPISALALYSPNIV